MSVSASSCRYWRSGLPAFHNSILRRFTQNYAVNATAGRCFWVSQSSEFTVNHFGWDL